MYGKISEQFFDIFLNSLVFSIDCLIQNNFFRQVRLPIFNIRHLGLTFDDLLFHISLKYHHTGYNLQEEQKKIIQLV